MLLRVAALMATGLLSSAVADPVFNSGGATLTFDPGAGAPTVVNLNPIPVVLSTQLDDTYSAGGLFATGRGGINHGESPNHFWLSFAGNSGVSQMDVSGDSNGAAVVTISFNSLWEFTSQFGPTAYGYGNFPSIVGSVAEGTGSYAMFELQGNFTGGATRSPLVYTYLQNSPGAFSTSFFDIEELTPNFIAANQTETISGYIRFTARGVDGLSDIGFGNIVAGTNPVPEPESYALGAGLALGCFAIYRRRKAGRRA